MLDLLGRWAPWAALLAMVIAAPALAQPAGEQDARYHFRLGQAHYESGHFMDAAREFEESHRLSQRPELLHNIYVAYRDAGASAQAADALERYLEAVPDAENRALLERRLAVLRRMAADAGGGATEAGADDASTTPSPDPSDDAEPTDTTTSTSSSSTSATTSEDTATGGGGLSPVGFIVGGVGAALLIGGAITGGLALAQESDLAAMCPDDMCPPNVDFASMADSGRVLALTTDVLIPVGVAAAAVGVVLILVLREGGSEDVAAGAACGPDGCFAGLRAAF